MFIDGIGIGGYRSFGELQKIGPFGKINIFIGQNNSGKSNILSFIAAHLNTLLASLKKRQPWNFVELDRHIGTKDSSLQLALAVPIGGEKYNQLSSVGLDAANRNAGDHIKQSSVEWIKKILGSPVLTHGGDVAWFEFAQVGAGGGLTLTLKEDLKGGLWSTKVLRNDEWQTLLTLLRGLSGADVPTQCIPQILDVLTDPLLSVPKIDFIPAIRRIGDSSSKPEDFSGLGIIERLARLQNPGHAEQAKRRHFEEINIFLKKVTGNSTAVLEIPYERDVILVHMDGKVLPLSSLGTGIHEVVILASAATVLRKQVLCIEEPELHLHPLLLRKLVKYLADKTDNQYFFTTHSAHLLDMSGAAIFHVRHQNGASVVESVHTSAAKSLVCADLGYRASDLLQANSIIWVEGPSDRTYLQHWIKAVAPELVEGLHFSIMYYGGRLLCHLSANDPEVTDFISLRRLNRHISILIDSDRPSANKPLNATKRRVRDEFDEGPGFAWVTKGREIENYIPPAILETAVKTVHPKVVALKKTGQFDRCLHETSIRGGPSDGADKVKVAHEVVKVPAELGVLDLKQQVTKLVKFIRAANDLDD